jgi:hypothetical protein
MITRLVRRSLALVSFFTASMSAAIAGGFSITSPQYLNLDTLGGTTYNITLNASVVVGWDYEASAYLTFGNINLYDYSIGYGEAGVYLEAHNIRKIDGVWVAETLYTWILNLNGSPIAGFQYNVPLPSNIYVAGSATCDGYTNPMWGGISW